MEATTVVISVSELKTLLFSIVRHELRVRIRYRTIGQLWHPNFLRIIKIEDEKRILFHDESRKRIISLSDFSTIFQFELDAAVENFEPHLHYLVSDENAKPTKHA